MLTGLALRIGVVLLLTIAELVVDVDIALPGREVDTLFGVISPDRSPDMFIISKIRRKKSENEYFKFKTPKIMLFSSYCKIKYFVKLPFICELN